MAVHPKVNEIAGRMGVGVIEAEQVLRGLALSDQGAAKAAAEIDTARKIERQTAADHNKDMAGRLGLGLDQVADLVAKLAGDAELETWLVSRVNRTAAQEGPLAHDE